MRIRDWSSDVCSSDLHQHADAAIFGAHDLLFGYFAVGEDKLGGRRAAHADLVDLLPDREPRHILFDQEGGDPARSSLGARLGVADQHVSFSRVWNRTDAVAGTSVYVRSNIGGRHNTKKKRK